MIYGRWSSIIYPIPLNPDEVQAAANTLRIMSDGFSWGSLDGTTVGPLNSIVLIWPKFIGLDVTLSFVRLTACFILTCICAFTYLSAVILSERWLAILCCAPLVLFYSFTKSTEFLHYSSELLPVLILSIVNFLVLSILNKSRTFLTTKLLLIGVLIGSVPFSKLQATPIAAIIGAYALFLIVFYQKKKRTKNITSLVFGVLVIPAFFLIPLRLSENFLDFWNSYIVWAGVYIKSPTSLLLIHHMITQDASLKYCTYFLLLLCLFSCLFVQRCIFSTQKKATLSLYLASLLAVIFFSISKPGNLFPHYLMFFPPFLVIFVAHSLQDIFRTLFHKIFFVFFYIFLFLSFLWLHSYDSNLDKFNFSRRSHKTILKQDFSITSPNIFSWLPATNNYLLIWGWMPQWYLLSNRAPATRESHTYGQIVDSKLNKYLRSRFLQDLKYSNPDYVLDAVNGSSFGFNNASKYSPSIFPEFNELLSSSYYELPSLKSNNKCPRLYIRNDLKDEVKSRLITPKSIKASETYGGNNSEFTAKNLFDNSLTEDSCIDYWLLPSNKLGFVKIYLNKPEAVSQISILNTRNGNYVDRSTRNIIVQLRLKGVLVAQHDVVLNSHPLWTFIDVDKHSLADSINIKIVSYNGLGAGLNEIKIFRRKY